jgi:5-methylcytosine-specific restriction protein A
MTLPSYSCKIEIEPGEGRMNILEISLKVGAEFITERQNEYADNALASLIRKEWPDSFYNAFPGYSTVIKAKASAGAGQWNAAPFMAFLDPRITTSPQSGYYPVILYERGFKSFCLVMAQGADSLKSTYGTKSALPILKSRALAIRTRAPKWEKYGFIEGPFQTYSRGNSHLGRDADDPWAVSVAFGKRYFLDNPPTLSAFLKDIQAILELYESISKSIGKKFIEQDQIAEQLALSGELPKVDASGIDGAIRIYYHKKTESRQRNSKLAKDIKAELGSTCQGCGITLSSVYGNIGTDFVEAHHLTPLSLAPKEGAQLTVKDFAVLCPTCHRIIHKLGCPELSVLRQTVNPELRDFYGQLKQKKNIA